MPKIKTKRVSKRSFVLSFPFEVAAKEVVAKAKEDGIRLKPEYVYVVRSNEKKGKGPKRGSSATGSLESEFRRLTIELGLDKSKALLRETEQKVAALIRGR